MPRGGYHQHAERWGRKSAWQTKGTTRTIRVPEALAEQILELAHKLDNKEILASDTKAEIDKLTDQCQQLTEANENLKAHLAEITTELDEYKARMASIERMAVEVKSDPVITRKGKDKGAIVRAVDALVAKLLNSCFNQELVKTVEAEARNLVTVGI